MRFWCDRKFATQARDILAKSGLDVRLDQIVAGKFRRYHHLSKLQHIIIPSVFWPNIRDLFLIVAGVVQSLVKLIIWRPDVVFTKGGYVCLPIGFAAHLLRIPLVIHDSDAHPGLTNRILARWATTIATGAPLEYYPSYPRARSHYVGIPVGAGFRPYSAADKLTTRERLGLSDRQPLVVITGGGLGAARLNSAVVAVAPELCQDMTVMLISGKLHYDELHEQTRGLGDNFILRSFVDSGMDDIMGAADVVVARAGATTILELAALHQVTILVPNAHLTGGHQLKNAAVYADAEAVNVIQDQDLAAHPELLSGAIRGLLNDPEAARAMAARFGSFARPEAAKDMSELILAAVRPR